MSDEYRPDGRITGKYYNHELLRLQEELVDLQEWVKQEGLPVGAYGGRADVMARVAPEGDVYQAGTLSGNPLAMRAGTVTLDLLRGSNLYDRLERKSERLARGFREAAAAAGVPVRLNRVGSMLTVFFTETEVIDFATARSGDPDRFRRWFHAMLDRGIYLAPSPFEALFVSGAHSDNDIDLTIAAAAEAFRLCDG